MKTRNMMKYFGGLFMIALTVATFGCNDFKYDTYQVTDKPYVDRTSVELYLDTDLSLASIQLKGSPEGQQFTWTCQNEAVATVTQAGLVTAKGEGYTNIIVTSGSDQFEVKVHVQKWIPVEKIILDVTMVQKYWYDKKDRFKINALYEPAEATEKDLIEWSTDNPDIATVTNEGWVTYTNVGKVKIYAKAKGVKDSVSLSVLEMPVYKITDPEFINRTNWRIPGYTSSNNDAQIGYSSQQHGDAGGGPGIMSMFDGNAGTFWHARWSPATAYPHWFIVDLGEVTEIGGAMVQNRAGNNGSAKGFQLFTTDVVLNNEKDLAEAAIWSSCGRFIYSATGGALTNFAILPPYPKTRYVKVYFGTEYKGSSDYTMIAEFGLYRPKPEPEP